MAAASESALGFGLPAGGLQKESQDRHGTPDRWEEWTHMLPFGRAATSSEIAAMVALLASDRSAYTTGTIVTIDGGIANGDSRI